MTKNSDHNVPTEIVNLCRQIEKGIKENSTIVLPAGFDEFSFALVKDEMSDGFKIVVTRND